MGPLGVEAAPEEDEMTKSIALALAVLAALAGAADAGTRCRTTKMGSTTYTTCESKEGRTDCRTSRVGSTTYTDCR